MDIKIDEEKIDPFYLSKQPIFTQLQTTIQKIDTDAEFCYVSEIEQYLTKNKYRTTDALTPSLGERVSIYQIEGNSLNFDNKSINSINQSLSNYSESKPGESFNFSSI
jgi:hypothetical protein